MRWWVLVQGWWGSGVIAGLDGMADYCACVCVKLSRGDAYSCSTAGPHVFASPTIACQTPSSLPICSYPVFQSVVIRTLPGGHGTLPGRHLGLAECAELFNHSFSLYLSGRSREAPARCRDAIWGLRNARSALNQTRSRFRYDDDEDAHGACAAACYW